MIWFEVLKIMFTVPLRINDKEGDYKTLFCLNVFTFDHQTFSAQTACHWMFKALCLCSKLIMKLVYYIHPGYGKKFLVSHRDRTRVLPNVSRRLYIWTRALIHTCYGFWPNTAVWVSPKNGLMLFSYIPSCLNFLFGGPWWPSALRHAIPTHLRPTPWTKEIADRIPVIPRGKKLPMKYYQCELKNVIYMYFENNKSP